MKKNNILHSFSFKNHFETIKKMDDFLIEFKDG